MSGTDKQACDRRRALARFEQLIERALFELRLAGDIARSETLGPALTRPVEMSRRILSGCLKTVKKVRSE